MIGAFAKKLFGSANDRVIKSLKKTVDAINALEPDLERLSDAELRARTDQFRERLAAGETLDDVLVEAFATVREAAKRTLGQRHFDVQLMGGMVLHQGKIAEMKTGEGKTLVATLPVYLNALQGKGVHVVTVNDYLARRDAEWMGEIYRFLGLSVGVHRARPRRGRARKQAYGADITYGTNNEFGLRLPARQHEVLAGGHGPARLQLRDRRRGRQHPGRRGAHAADHLRPERGQLRALSRDRQAISPTSPRRTTRRTRSSGRCR